MSLVAGWFPVTVAVVAIVSLLALVPWEKRARWRVAGVAVVVAAVVVVATQVLLDVSGALPWPLPWTFDAWLGVVVLVPLVAVLAWRHVRWRRLLSPLALVTCLAAAATVVNQHYDYLPTTQALLDPTTDVSTVHDVQTLMGQSRVAHHHVTRHGVVLQLDIPGTVSHFPARDAYVWLPPSYLDDQRHPLPVLELLGGTPSDPVDWIRGGDAATTADRYAATHGGEAPLIVMPDDNGSLTGDTECLDGPSGNAATYLAVDVPAYMRHTFQAATGPDSLAVAGLSEGGTCALDLALTHPGEYRAFGDYSGLAAPTVGTNVAPAATTRALFHGSFAAYQAHDPSHLLRTRHYAGLAGWFEAGSADAPCVRAQTMLAPLARSAGVDTRVVEVPGGGHTFTLWATALRDSLPFLASQLGTAGSPSAPSVPLTPQLPAHRTTTPAPTTTPQPSTTPRPTAVPASTAATASTAA